MPKSVEGDLNGAGHKVGIVVSRFNDFITGRLVDGAVDCLVRHGVKDSDIEVVKVPGAFEILEASIPVLFGVLTTDNLEQAIERAGAKSGNKGWETALAAIEMINLYKQL